MTAMPWSKYRQSVEVQASTIAVANAFFETMYPCQQVETREVPFWCHPVTQIFSKYCMTTAVMASQCTPTMPENDVVKVVEDLFHGVSMAFSPWLELQWIAEPQVFTDDDDDSFMKDFVTKEGWIDDSNKFTNGVNANVALN